MAFTFDDGPSPSNTYSVLRALALYNVKATFFLIGVNVRAYPKLLETSSAKATNSATTASTTRHIGPLRWRARYRATTTSFRARREFAPW